MAKRKKFHWDLILSAIYNKPKGAKGKASIKRDKRQALELARKGKTKHLANDSN